MKNHEGSTAVDEAQQFKVPSPLSLPFEKNQPMSAPSVTETSSPAALPTPSYPAIEAFVEVALPDAVAQAFADLHTHLVALKGPRAEHGKKVSKAIERTQELLNFLLQLREKIEEERKNQAGAKR
jgi:hypothetical protein